MNAEGKKRVLPSLSTSIMIGLGFGILNGIFFGEYCSKLQVFGEAFIKLLQMSILPYIVISLLAGIGQLSYDRAKLLAVKAGLLLLVLWGVGFVIILVMPLAFPAMKSASFFSSAMVETTKKINIIDLYIPANPFRSLANNVVPAVVFFSISIGIALIGIRDKQNLINDLNILSKALMKVARFVVYLTPIGVFAISASAAGTLTIDEFGRLQAYFTAFILAAILLAFWVLPMLVISVTPFKYKDIVGFSKDALVTGFTTGNLFIILPVMIQSCKDLLEKYHYKEREVESYVDIIIPVTFNFPSLGKLLALLFVMFAAWFYGTSLSLVDYPNFIVSGLFSFFGSVDMALPFMFDILEIPSDAFQLYLVTGVINVRFQALLGTMHYISFTLIAICAITGRLSVNLRKISLFILLSIVLTTGTIVGTRHFLSLSVQRAYVKDKIVANMQLLHDPINDVVHKTVPAGSEISDPKISFLDRVKGRGTLKVGYLADNLPFSFFNKSGELVGYDIDMAHRLARELGVGLEFIPCRFDTMARQLNEGHFDIVMSGIPMTTGLLEEMVFTEPYLDLTWSLVVKDYRRKDFDTLKEFDETEGLRIGVPNHSSLAALIEEGTQVTAIRLNAIRDFFESEEDSLDALLISAEAGSAWTLLYPEYRVVIPKPTVFKIPVGYPIAGNDPNAIAFMNNWITAKKKDNTIKEMYDYWILGKGATKKGPRWSVIRDVLHWVE